MGRKSYLNLAKVKVIIDELTRGGIATPSGNHILEYINKNLKAGETSSSLGTIQKFIDEIKLETKIEEIGQQNLKVPDEVNLVIIRALESAVRGAKSEFDIDIQRKKEEIDALLKESSKFENQVNFLSDAVDQRTSERDILVGQLSLVNGALADHKRFLSNEIETRTSLQTEIAELRFRDSAFKEKLEDARFRSADLTKAVEEQKLSAQCREVELRTEISEYKSDLDAERKLRFEIEKKAELLNVRLESIAESLKSAEMRNAQLMTVIQSNESWIARASAGEAVVPELKARIDLLHGIAFPNGHCELVLLEKSNQREM